MFYVGEIDPGIADDEVLDLANREGALLLTADKDFGELVFRQRRLVSGVVLHRLSGLSLITAEILSHAINCQNYNVNTSKFCVALMSIPQPLALPPGCT